MDYFLNGSHMIMFPKRERYRNRALLNTSQDQQCAMRSPVCDGSPKTVVAAHSNLGEDGKGYGQKADDDISVDACGKCHDWYDKSPAPKAEKQAVFDRGFVRTYKRRKAEGIIKL